MEIDDDSDGRDDTFATKKRRTMSLLQLAFVANRDTDQNDEEEDDDLGFDFNHNVSID